MKSRMREKEEVMRKLFAHLNKKANCYHMCGELEEVVIKK